MKKPDVKAVYVKTRAYPAVKRFIRSYGLSLRPRRNESDVVNEALREFFLHPKRRDKVAAIGEFPGATL